MPASSEKQAKLFRLVRAVQKGKVSPKKVSKNVRQMAKSISPTTVKDFTKLNEDGEGEYTLSKFKQIKDKSFNDLLNENLGIPFDKQELIVFQSKQDNFAGFGKTSFLLNKNKNEIVAELFSNGTTKKFVFKKLIDNKDKNVNKYSLFIQITYPDKPDKDIFYTLSNNFNDKNISEKTKILSDFIERINSYGI